MNLPDLANAGFEGAAAIASVFNVRAILRDRAVKGFSVGSTAFFTVWGCWNFYYYPHLGQWWSFAASLAIVAVNTVWIVLIVRYTREAL